MTLRARVAALAALLAASACSWAGAVEPAADPANWRRVEPSNLVLFRTNRGDILVELAPHLAPGHVERVKQVVKAGHYDGTLFHRVIDTFMAQGGDVAAVRPNLPPYGSLKLEAMQLRDPATTPMSATLGAPEDAVEGYIAGNPVGAQPAALAELTGGKVETWGRHCAGAASMARTDDPDSGQTGFFLVRQTSPWLDFSSSDYNAGGGRRPNGYTVWGQVVSGLDVVRAIKAGDPDNNGAVANPDKLLEARLVADLPAPMQPVVWVQRTDGPEFRESLARAAASGVKDICAAPMPAAIVEKAK